MPARASPPERRGAGAWLLLGVRFWLGARLGPAARLGLGARRVGLLPGAGLAVALAGCGSAAVADLPPAAGPRLSPPLTAAPAGRVVRVGLPLDDLAPGRTASPGGAPEGLAFDPASGRLAVGLRSPAQLVLLDGTTGRVADRVPLPAAPRHLATEAGEVLVPAEAAGRLLRVTARDGRVVQDVRVGVRPHDVLAAGAGRALVDGDRVPSGAQGVGAARRAAREPGALTLSAAGRAPRSVPVAAQPDGLALVSSGRVAVVSGRARTVELFDGTTLAPLARADAGIGPTHAAAQDNWLWVTDTQGDALLVFRTRPKLELVRRVYLAGGPYAIAVDTAKRRLWVTLTRTNELVELPAHGRPHVLRRFPTVRQPDSLVVDPATQRVFVGGRDDGVVELIDPGPLR